MFIRRVFKALGFRALGLVAAFLTSVLLGRTLGAEALGFISLAVAIASFGNLLINIGLQNSLTKFIAKFEAHGESNKSADIIKKSFLIRHLNFVVVVFLFALTLSLISDWIGVDDHQQWLFFLFVCVFLMAGLNGIYGAILKGLGKAWQAIAVEQSLVPLFNALLCFLVYFLFKLSLLNVVIIYASMTMLTLLIGKRLINKYQPSINDSASIPVSTIIKGSIPLFLAASMQVLMNQTDVVMLGHFLDTATVGGYSVAMKIALMMNMLLVISNAFISPKIAAFDSLNDKNGLKKIIWNTFSLHILISLFILGFFLLFDELILGLFGQEFVGYKSVFWILLAGQLINFIFGSMGYVLAFTKDAFWYTAIIFVGCILNVVCNYQFIQLMEVEGAAIATAGTVSFVNLCFFAYVLWHFFYGRYANKTLSKK